VSRADKAAVSSLVSMAFQSLQKRLIVKHGHPLPAEVPGRVLPAGR
jgi:hypothetical protein